MVQAGEQREAVRFAVMFVVHIWKWSEEVRWLILSVYGSCVNHSGSRRDEWDRAQVILSVISLTTTCSLKV